MKLNWDFADKVVNGSNNVQAENACIVLMDF